jgi:hypothetical protein
MLSLPLEESAGILCGLAVTVAGLGKVANFFCATGRMAVAAPVGGRDAVSANFFFSSALRDW